MQFASKELWSGAEPWRGIHAVACHLLEQWCRVLQSPEAALCWFDETVQVTICLRLWPAGPEHPAVKSRCVTLRNPGAGLTLPAPEEWPDRSPQPVTLQWSPFTNEPALGGDPVIGIPVGIDRSQLPTDWEDVSLTLFRWAQRYELQLRDQKLSALAEFAAGAGHEINNPLGSIIGRASQLLKEANDPESRRLLETIGAQAYRIGDMIGDTMLFANPPQLHPEPIDLADVVNKAVSRFEREISTSGSTLSMDCEESVEVLGDATQLLVVVSELLRNALKALRDVSDGEERRLAVRCQMQIHAAKTGGAVSVVDSGPGLTSVQAEHCFDPFFSGDQAGRGLGFGLSKCWRIVKLHRGEIALQRSGDETHVRFWIPGP